MANRKFHGIEISNYGEEYGYVDYRTLSKCFNHILANTYAEDVENTEHWEHISGELQNEYGAPAEIFQFYIVDEWGSEILADANEIVFYDARNNWYVWCVTHLGTSWDYVLTDIKV